MNRINNLLEIINESTRIDEGMKIGRKETEEVLKHANHFNIGIEYELILASGEQSIHEAKQFIEKYNIGHIHTIINEHAGMMEIITEKMPLDIGLKHIQHFLASATEHGMTFPSTAGMHVSISHVGASGKEINFTKFLVLMAGDYLHSIFPERPHVSNIASNINSVLRKTAATTVNEIEDNINTSIAKGELGEKHISTKLSDYNIMDGRIELRYIGGEHYNKRYEEIRWHVLRSVFILGIAYDPAMYRKEYLTMLHKLIDKSYDGISIKELIDTLILSKPHTNRSASSKLKDMIYSGIVSGEFKNNELTYAITVYTRTSATKRDKKMERFISNYPQKIPEYISALASNQQISLTDVTDAIGDLNFHKHALSGQNFKDMAIVIDCHPELSEMFIDDIIPMINRIPTNLHKSIVNYVVHHGDIEDIVPILYNSKVKIIFDLPLEDQEKIINVMLSTVDDNSIETSFNLERVDRSMSERTFFDVELDLVYDSDNNPIINGILGTIHQAINSHSELNHLQHQLDGIVMKLDTSVYETIVDATEKGHKVILMPTLSKQLSFSSETSMTKQLLSKQYGSYYHDMNSTEVQRINSLDGADKANAKRVFQQKIAEILEAISNI